jgi:outer membrane protein assembly factor BamB
MRYCGRLLLCVALLGITTQASSAPDPRPGSKAEGWTEFRGPSGQGQVDGDLPLTWGKGKNQIWKQDIPGSGWSSPVVTGGRIYLTTSVAGENKDQSLRALCLDAESGQILWNKEIFLQDGKKAPRIHSKGTHANPTPLFDGERLFVHFGHQGSACLDRDGNIVWRNAELKYAPVHGNGGSPILTDKALVFSCDGSDQQFIVALARKDGKVLWKTDRKSKAPKRFSFSTPLLISVKDQKQIISPASDAVIAYDADTGNEIWRVRYTGYSVIPRPIFGHGLIFMSTSYDSPSVLAIRPDGKGDVTDTHVAWTMKKGAPHTPSLLLVGEELYMVSDGGIASCVEAKTGNLHWQQRLGGNFSASPVHAKGKIYFQSEQGVGTVVQAGKEFKQLARNDLGERTLASYAASGGALYLRTERSLYRFQER